MKCAFALLVLAATAPLSIAHAQISTNWSTLLDWNQTGAPGENWASITSSSDGAKLAAVVNGGGIWTSTNAGANWHQTSAPNSDDWTCITCSADGTHLVAASLDIGIYFSTDAGVTWTQAQGFVGWGLYLWSITSSADGNNVAVVDMNQGEVWTSTDTGVDWNYAGAPSTNLSCITSSSDGTRLAVTVNGGGIYLSPDGGNTWPQTSAPSKAWTSIVSSSDGTRLVAVAGTGEIYTSTNSGSTWQPRSSTPLQEWSSVASSTDGTKLGIVANCCALATSTNAGATWTQADTSVYFWGSVASSADGTRLAAVLQGGGIWTAQATLQTNTPRMTISHSGTNVVVSWPATGSYTLQQNTNLSLRAGWMTSSYTNSTANGTNSIIVTHPAGTLFFRLTQP